MDELFEAFLPFIEKVGEAAGLKEDSDATSSLDFKQEVDQPSEAFKNRKKVEADWTLFVPDFSIDLTGSIETESKGANRLKG